MFAANWDRDLSLDSFLVYIKTELDLSKNTIESYRSDIKHFLDFLESNQIEFSENFIEKIRLYLKHLNDAGLRKASFLRKVSSLNKFFNFLVSEKKIDSNPMIKIKRPKSNVVVPRFMTDEEMKMLLDSISMDKSKNGLRDLLMVELIYVSGMRVSEMVNLKLENVLEFLKRDKSDAKMMLIFGKGRKERMVPLRDKTIELLKQFIQSAKMQESKVKSKFLFPSRSKLGHVTREQVGIMLKKRTLECGLDPAIISPHVLRHSFATNMCKKNVNLRLVQQMLGHSSISTTEIYLHNATNEVLDFVKKTHPIGKN